MILLKDWKLNKDVWSSSIDAEGHVEGHHSIEDGKWIVTSNMVSIAEDESGEFLHLYTESGSHYKLELQEVNRMDIEETCEVLRKKAIKEMYCQVLMAYAKEKTVQAMKEIESTLERQELHLVFLGVIAKQAFWRNAKGEFQEIHIGYHTGTMKDSVLVTKSTPEMVDFRYFPMWNDIKPYSWNHEIKAVRVDNTIAMELHFYGPTGSDRYVTCPGRTCTRITLEEHLSEEFGVSEAKPMISMAEINRLLGGVADMEE